MISNFIANVIDAAIAVILCCIAALAVCLLFGF